MISLQKPFLNVKLSNSLWESNDVIKYDFHKYLQYWIEKEYISTYFNISVLWDHLLQKYINDDHKNEIILSPFVNPKIINSILKSDFFKPIFVDVDPETGNITYETIQSKITEKTSLVIVSLYGGLPSDLDVKTFLGNTGINVITDGSMSIGSKWRGSNIGFYNDTVVYDLGLGSLAWINNIGVLGSDNKDSILFHSENFDNLVYDLEPSNIDYALGIEQLQHVLPLQNINYQIIKRYEEAFDEKNIKYRKLYKQNEYSSSFSSFQLFLDEPDKYIDFMKNNNITVDRLIKRVDKFKICRNLDNKELVNTNEFYNKAISIPVGYWLDNTNVDKIISKTIEFIF